MASSTWKEASKASQPSSPASYVSLLSAKKFFAVDASGSTECDNIISTEASVVYGFHGNSKDTAVKWGTSCTIPELVDSIPERPSAYVARYGTRYWSASQGGTAPETILREASALENIRSSDVWYLLTDGEIDPPNVTTLTQIAACERLSRIPVILVIVQSSRTTPEQTNISVGISFFASATDALIIFKDTRSQRLYIVAAKGVFGCLVEDDTINLSSWASLPSYDDERSFNKHIEELDIQVMCVQDRQMNGGVSLGPAWDEATGAFVLVDKLLDQDQIEIEDLRHLLQEEAITQLSIVCKTRNQLDQLRGLLLRQKRQDIIVKLEDLNGATQILERIRSGEGNQTPEKVAELQEQLRNAHAANRATYSHLKDSPDEKTRLARELNRLIDRSLAIMSGIEKAGYTADILSRKSNRAMRAGTVAATDADIHISSLNLEDPSAFRSFCPICCGDDEIMSIVLKEMDKLEENTTDFALNFPLAAGHARQNADMISSQCICFQCALLCSPISIFKEDVVATLPTVEYSGANKRYINHQLTLAITNGVATGMVGIVQIFMTMVDSTLANKEWCSSASEDAEILCRRRALEWILGTLLKNLRTRETFSETGSWVPYSKALLWAANEDFVKEGLESWMIQYPLAGFNQLIRWYRMLCLIDEDAIQAIQVTKLIHYTATALMYGLLKQSTGHTTQPASKAWKHPFLQVIYRSFNAPLIPKDNGPTSLIHPDSFWPNLSKALGSTSRTDVRLFLASGSPCIHNTAHKRLQLLIFWALFTQKGHTSAKTFLQTLQLREALAPALLDPKSAGAPAHAVDKILTSLFCSSGISTTDVDHPADFIPPFVTPFGPSVLGCGFPDCGVKFYDDADDTTASTFPDVVRHRRAVHLKEVFGVGDKGFAGSETGMPELTVAPGPPSSSHFNLHVSVARVWSGMEVKRRREVWRVAHAGRVGGDDVGDGDGGDVDVDGGDRLEGFVAAVCEEICERGKGNVYFKGLERDVRVVLPSFWHVLAAAAVGEGVGVRAWEFEICWEGNSLGGKIGLELELELGLGLGAL
ncbi:hypothetical protein MMC12_002897 [Toensbergia leucococca]|nr:hypothetical protein [Toensbergia leucococca]